MFINMEARTGVEPATVAYETTLINPINYEFTIKLTPCGGECRGRTCKTLFNVYGLAIRCNTIIRTHRIVNGGR